MEGADYNAGFTTRGTNMASVFRMSVAGATVLLAASLADAQSKGKMQTRHIFVRVVDQEGAPVAGLATSDFNLTEAGAPRVVTKAAPAQEPMRIALVLDTSDGAVSGLTHMRVGTMAFLDALPPDDEVMIVTTGRQLRVRTQPTTERKKLKDTASGLFSDGGATVLADGLLEIDDRFFKKADDRWPVFVIFTSDGAEGSSAAHEKEFNKWAVALGERGVTVHAFVLKSARTGGGMPEIIAQSLAQNTGGRYDMMNTTNALPDKMKALARQLAADRQKMAAWYRVDFQTDSTRFMPIDVGVARNGVKLELSDRRRIQ
jgi:VWA domain-containing protein